jgi:hypothetical protein
MSSDPATSEAGAKVNVPRDSHKSDSAVILNDI